MWVGRPERLRLLTSVSFIDQMSKSTGNFLTLSQAIDKFSADGIISFFLIYLSFCLFLFLSLFIVFFSMALSSYHETWEKTLQVYIWNRFQLCFPSAWAVMDDYIVNISYPLVMVFRKWTHFDKIDEVLMLSIMSCCICQVSQWTVSKTFLYNYVICTL